MNNVKASEEINRWETLFQDIKNYLHLPPDSNQVQTAARRWQIFLEQHGGNDALEKEYTRLYQSVDTDLIKKQAFYNEVQQLQDFVAQALKVQGTT